MTDKPEKPGNVTAEPAPELVPDPNRVPILHVSGVSSAIMNGQTIAMVLVMDRTALQLDGLLRTDPEVVAKLRFDLNVATRIRDQLNGHISGLTAGPRPDEKRN